MTTDKQIKIVVQMMEGLNELIGHQDGWDDVIEDGEELLKFLETKQKQ